MRKRMMHMAAVGATLMLTMAICGSAWALGLGQIKSDTRIGQALEARIPILASTANGLQGLRVGLASPEDYKQAGLKLNDYLYTLKFEVKQSASGPYVLISSPQPVKLPFLNILVTAHWMSGEVTRQYTILLNPPVFADSGDQAERTTVQPAAVAPSRPARSARNAQAPARSARQATSGYKITNTGAASGATQVRRYGPVERGDTLWGIANRLHAAAGVSINQMIIAIYRANPQAFSGNINRLKTGYVLKVPAHSTITRVPSRVAAARIESQNQHWRAFKADRNRNAKLATESGQGAYSGRIEASQPLAKTDTGNTANAANPPRSGGEVVLTAPRVSANAADATRQPESASKASQTATPQPAQGQPAQEAVAAGAVPPAAGNQTGVQTQAGAGANNPAAATQAASSSGLVKVNNGELAALASGQNATQQSTPKSADTPSSKQAKASKVAPAEHVDSSNQFAQHETGDGIVYEWLTTPKGWIVIAVIVILLLLGAIVLVRRRRAQTQWSAQEGAVEEESAEAQSLANDDEFAVTEQHHEHAAQADAVAAAQGFDDLDAASDEADANAFFARDDGDDLLFAQPDEGGDEKGDTESSEDELTGSELADALVEADFYAGSGDHAGAARSLATALQLAPERNDLRLRRLEALHAAGESENFLEDAEALHGRVDESSADWQTVAIMGRQLLPDQALFKKQRGPSEDESPAGAGEVDDADTPDFDQELDRLTRTEAAPSLQDDFERTLGELSTMIETYMPEDGAMPNELQPSPGESLEEQSRHETIAAAPSFDDDDVLEFEPQELPESGSQADSEGDQSGQKEPLERLHQGNVLMHLELARSYMDMGDHDTARATLEEVLESAEGKQREEAERLLTELGAKRANDTGGEAALVDARREDDESNLDFATGPQDDAAKSDEDFGSALDLARAYIEMGDQESARDLLEEVLDGGDQEQRTAARGLLDTMEA